MVNAAVRVLFIMFGLWLAAHLGHFLGAIAAVGIVIFVLGCFDRG